MQKVQKYAGLLALLTEYHAVKAPCEWVQIWYYINLQSLLHQVQFIPNLVIMIIMKGIKSFVNLSKFSTKTMKVGNQLKNINRYNNYTTNLKQRKKEKLIPTC